MNTEPEPADTPVDDEQVEIAILCDQIIREARHSAEIPTTPQAL